MRISVEKEEARCRELVANYTQTADSCLPNFDGSICWESCPVGTSMQLECPFEFCTHCHLQDRFVERRCSENGTWESANYENCVFIFTHNGSCIEKICHGCPDPFRDSFRRDQVFNGCTGLDPKKIDWLCKLILATIMYSTLSSVLWMFLEGAYLVSRFTVFAMRSIEGHFLIYIAVGWGLPVLFVLGWVLALELQPVVPRCWLPYTGNSMMWLLIGPMSVALGLNFLFLLVIVVVLVQKLWASNTAESRKIWKTIKATLLLVPLLGLTNLLLFYEPNSENKVAYHAYMLSSAILQHSQGIFVGIFYCFGNAEVQTALRRRIERCRLYQPLVLKNRSFSVAQANTALHRRTDQITEEMTIVDNKTLYE
ncbi:Corticotropin-releasing factor receptor 2 [Trichinella pseudospiralis]|uniref:Corticotropin-releasing factor receptor 2 n=1 Tax=Trichinella pseudospiralis TaxID=6337 RepID=A0A0V1G3J6_TRIPS|nr:Corticotropin-releasing factor receptor 2 [Trichinella pseudospiralis]